MDQPGSLVHIYEIKIKEHLDPDWNCWLDNFTITQQADGTTTITGPVSDQPALYGLLMKIHQLNLSLISVNRIR